MFKNIFNFKGSPKISEKILEQYGINVINKYILNVQKSI